MHTVLFGTLMLCNENVINVWLPILMLTKCQKSGSNNGCIRSVLVFGVMTVAEGPLDLGK